MQTLAITPIPAFIDNYIWCLHDQRLAVIVDPGDAAPVQAFLEQNGLDLGGILVTHHHWDHINGIQTLTDQWPGIPVWGPAGETIPCRTDALSQGDHVMLPIGVKLEVLDLPGHTLGHIGYYCAAFGALGPVVFCGDTLFSSGCGRLFEGTPEQMHNSLSLLANLPAATKVYCTHEYTLSNLKFALTVEPDNHEVRKRVEQVEGLRQTGLPSLPTSIALEKAVNPFIRVDNVSVKQAVGQNCGVYPEGDLDTFAKLRLWKDRF